MLVPKTKPMRKNKRVRERDFVRSTGRQSTDSTDVPFLDIFRKPVTGHSLTLGTRLLDGPCLGTVVGVPTQTFVSKGTNVEVYSDVEVGCRTGIRILSWSQSSWVYSP